MSEQDRPVAMVTGGTGQVGKATAAELARRGWSILIQFSPGQGPGEPAVADIEAAARQAGMPVEVAAAEADLTRPADREQLVEQVLERFGRIDMLVHGAAGTPGEAADLLEVTEEVYQQVMNAGVAATFFLTQLVANEMVRQVEAGLIENPKIVTINSLSAYTTSSDHGPYCMSRSTLSMMTRLFADRLGEHGINVYEIRAGIISSGASDAAHARYDHLIAQGLTPIRRWGRGGDIARAVAAIAEDLLSFSTGEVINVDGGFHLRRL